MISLSIVSHGQFPLVKNLLDTLEKYCKNTIEVLLTINIPENLPKSFSEYSFPVYLITNKAPRGFGANHNTAFKQAKYDFFCVLNPDIKLIENPFFPLIAAPAIINERGELQDNARKFLTLPRLFKRILGNKKQQNISSYPDWIGGMFMLFRKEIYKEIHGFDENYYLYCEDMDLCMRLRKKNYQVYYNSAVKVIHYAQKQSHKNIRYFIWHLQSLLLYFLRKNKI
jgi:N-acetylglucosaminyl-diphospho-decaprenol L-rhamnosyltransferase